jgi:uncharacterized phage-associated protein
MYIAPIDNHHWRDPKLVASHVLALRAGEGLPTTALLLVKIVYICHGWMLGLTDEELISEHVEAWDNGPVIAGLHTEYRRFGGYPIQVRAEKQALTEDQAKIIDAVHDVYKSYSGAQLSELTHRVGTPWHDIYHRDGPGAVIPSPLIRNHYRETLGVGGG